MPRKSVYQVQWLKMGDLDLGSGLSEYEHVYVGASSRTSAKIFARRELGAPPICSVTDVGWEHLPESATVHEAWFTPVTAGSQHT